MCQGKLSVDQTILQEITGYSLKDEKLLNIKSLLSDRLFFKGDTQICTYYICNKHVFLFLAL